MVHFFNRIIKNILHKFILHEIITFDDRDPPWIESKVKMRHISVLKDVIATVSTLNIFNPFRIY